MTSVHAQHEALWDAWRKDSPAPQDILGAHGLLKQRTKRVVERALEAALSAHLGAAPQGRHGPAAPHARPGKGQQTVQTDTGPLAVAVPRDRHGSGAPPRVPQRQRRREGCEAPGWRLDARGLSPRESQGPRAAWEGTEGAPTRIATLTAAGWDEGQTWQARPLASVSPRLDVDALLVTARPAGPVQTTAVDRVRGLPRDGATALLGRGRRESAGAQCWRSVFPAWQQRGGQERLSS